MGRVRLFATVTDDMPIQRLDDSAPVLGNNVPLDPIKKGRRPQRDTRHFANAHQALRIAALIAKDKARREAEREEN